MAVSKPLSTLSGKAKREADVRGARLDIAPNSDNNDGAPISDRARFWIILDSRHAGGRRSGTVSSYAPVHGQRRMRVRQ